MQGDFSIFIILSVINKYVEGERTTHVRIPRGLFSTVTIAELVLLSSIFLVAPRTVSFGSTVTTLEIQPLMGQKLIHIICL